MSGCLLKTSFIRWISSGCLVDRCTNRWKHYSAESILISSIHSASQAVSQVIFFPPKSRISWQKLKTRLHVLPEEKNAMNERPKTSMGGIFSTGGRQKRSTKKNIRWKTCAKQGRRGLFVYFFSAEKMSERRRKKKVLCLPSSGANNFLLREKGQQNIKYAFPPAAGVSFYRSQQRHPAAG